MIIAIDGTTASGKGTLSRRLADAYGLGYLDTGSLYRAVGLAALETGTDLSDAGALATLARRLDPASVDDRKLRTAGVGEAASRVAAITEVRTALLDLQRDFAQRPGGAILDGRDIGTVVCPDADVKLWIDASLEKRAERRWRELVAGGEHLELEDVIVQLARRDERDRARRDAPMKPAADAVLIDTTDLTIDAAVEKARQVIDEFLGEQDGLH
jgi:cytidylate kinase